MSQDIYHHILEIPIGGTTYYFTDAGDDWTHNGNTYLSGFLTPGTIPDIPQTSLPRENQVDFTLYDLDNTLSTAILNAAWRNRRPILDEVVFNPDYTIKEINRLYRGRIYDFEQSETDTTRTVTLICKDIHAIDKQRGRRTNVKSQAQVDPTDFCFEFTSQAGKELPWGRPGTLPPIGRTRDNRNPIDEGTPGHYIP